MESPLFRFLSRNAVKISRPWKSGKPIAIWPVHLAISSKNTCRDFQNHSAFRTTSHLLSVLNDEVAFLLRFPQFGCIMIKIECQAVGKGTSTHRGATTCETRGSCGHIDPPTPKVQEKTPAVLNLWSLEHPLHIGSVETRQRLRYLLVPCDWYLCGPTEVRKQKTPLQNKRLQSPLQNCVFVNFYNLLFSIYVAFTVLVKVACCGYPKRLNNIAFLTSGRCDKVPVSAARETQISGIQQRFLMSTDICKTQKVKTVSLKQQTFTTPKV
jgi:hypothetical protein